MSELEAIDPALFFRGGEGDPRVGELVQPGPVRIAEGDDGALVAIVGIADDRGVVNGGGRAGAAQGPRELRRWLYKMTTGGGGELSRLRLFDLGDATPSRKNASPESQSSDLQQLTEASSIEEVHSRAEAAVAQAIAAGARVVLLGGGHDGAYASQSGLLAALPQASKLAAINVDAHCDVRPLKDGKIITSGTPFRRLHDRFGERFKLVEFGIQMQHNARAHVEWAHAQGWPVLELRRLREDGCERRFARQLSRARTSADVLSVSFDLDSVEAASAPGVSAPCPDGFTPAELYSFARDAGRESAVRLLDVMECAPALDEGGRTARLGAAAIWNFLAGVCESR